MKKRTLLAAGLAAFPALSFAQLGDGPSGGRRRRRPADGRGGGQKPQVDLLEATLFEFHEDLKPADAQQEEAWQRYADAVRALAADAKRREKARAEEVVDVLQRLDRAVDAARNRYAALEEVSDRAHALYRSLAPAQRTAADPRLVNVALEAAGQSSVRR